MLILKHYYRHHLLQFLTMLFKKIMEKFIFDGNKNLFVVCTDGYNYGDIQKYHSFNKKKAGYLIIILKSI